jgi:hypothetical protein
LLGEELVQRNRAHATAAGLERAAARRAVAELAARAAHQATADAVAAHDHSLARAGAIQARMTEIDGNLKTLRSGNTLWYGEIGSAGEGPQPSKGCQRRKLTAPRVLGTVYGKRLDADFTCTALATSRIKGLCGTQLRTVSLVWLRSARLLWNGEMRMRHSVLVRGAVFCGLALALGCGERHEPLSPCRAQVLKDSERYTSQHTPDAEWQPLIQAELQRCIEQEQAK